MDEEEKVRHCECASVGFVPLPRILGRPRSPSCRCRSVSSLLEPGKHARAVEMSDPHV